jgi:hypothetical protein
MQGGGAPFLLLTLGQRFFFTLDASSQLTRRCEQGVQCTGEQIRVRRKLFLNRFIRLEYGDHAWLGQ